MERWRCETFLSKSLNCLLPTCFGEGHTNCHSKNCCQIFASNCFGITDDHSKNGWHFFGSNCFDFKKRTTCSQNEPNYGSRWKMQGGVHMQVCQDVHMDLFLPLMAPILANLCQCLLSFGWLIFVSTCANPCFLFTAKIPILAFTSYSTCSLKKIRWIRTAGRLRFGLAQGLVSSKCFLVGTREDQAHCWMIELPFSRDLIRTRFYRRGKLMLDGLFIQCFSPRKEAIQKLLKLGIRIPAWSRKNCPLVNDATSSW